MKRTIIYSIALIFLTNIIYAESSVIDIYEAVQYFKEKSTNKKLEDIEKKKLEIEKIGFEKNRQSKTQFTLKTNNSVTKSGESPVSDGVTTWKWNINPTVTYREFFIDCNYITTNRDNASLVYEDYMLKDKSLETQIDRMNIGIRKSLNDFFYSEEKYNENILIYKVQSLENSQKDTRYTEIGKVIDQYVDIKNNEAELDTKRNLKKENLESLKSTKEKFAKGEASELEVNLMEIENLKLDEDIKYLTEKIENAKKELCLKIGRDYYENLRMGELKDIDINEMKLNTYPIEGKKIEEQIKNEEIRYIDRQTQWNVDTSLSYDLKNKQWVFNLEFKGDVFDYKTDRVKKESEIEKTRLEREQLEDENEQKRASMEIEYRHLNKMVDIALSTKSVNEKKFEYTKKMLFKGYIDTVEYIKARNEAKSADAELRKAKNNLNGFKYKIVLLGG